MILTDFSREYCFAALLAGNFLLSVGAVNRADEIACREETKDEKIRETVKTHRLNSRHIDFIVIGDIVRKRKRR